MVPSPRGSPSGGVSFANADLRSIDSQESRDSSTSSRRSVVKVIAPSDDGPGGMKLARGFTITVSAPPDEAAETEESVDGRYSREDSNQRATQQQPQFFVKQLSDFEHLQPDDFTVEIPFNQTESRLPSLEDMLADEHIKTILDSSEYHTEVQNAIVVEDEKTKYENLMALVQKSFRDESWRNGAGKDRNLIDTLVLFCRQRMTTAQNPRAPSSDSLRRSKSFRSTLSRRSMSSIHSDKGGDFFPPSPKITSGGGFMSLCQPMRNESDAHIAALNLALVGAAAKLLRNLCVHNFECQTYLHEHRLVDLLTDRVDLIVEVTSWLNRNLKNFESAGGVPIRWFQGEIYQLSRTILQLSVNVMAGHQRAKAHILEHCVPDSLLKIVLLNGDIDMLSSFLHTVVIDQSAEQLHTYFFDAPLSGQLWLWLLAAYWASTPEGIAAGKAAAARKRRHHTAGPGGGATVSGESPIESLSEPYQASVPTKIKWGRLESGLGATSASSKQPQASGEWFQLFLANFLTRRVSFISLSARDDFLAGGSDTSLAFGGSGSLVVTSPEGGASALDSGGERASMPSREREKEGPPEKQQQSTTFFAEVVAFLLHEQMLPNHLLWHRLQNSPATTHRSLTSRESSRRASYDGGSAVTEGEEESWMMTPTMREADKGVVIRVFWQLMDQMIQSELGTIPTAIETLCNRKAAAAASADLKKVDTSTTAAASTEGIQVETPLPLSLRLLVQPESIEALKSQLDLTLSVVANVGATAEPGAANLDPQQKVRTGALYGGGEVASSAMALFDFLASLTAAVAASSLWRPEGAEKAKLIAATLAEGGKSSLPDLFTTFTKPLLESLLAYLRSGNRDFAMPAMLSVANLVFKDLRGQQWLLEQPDGLDILTGYATRVDPQCPMAREAAIFALRNVTKERREDVGGDATPTENIVFSKETRRGSGSKKSTSATRKVCILGSK